MANGRKRIRTRAEFLAGLGLAGSLPFVLGMSRRRKRRRRRDGPGTEPEAPASRPNVVLILTDDQPGHTLVQMPRLRAAFSGGVDLTRSAYATIPVCGPARTTISTERYPHVHNVISNNQPPAHPTYLEGRWPRSDLFVRMKAPGYGLGFFGKVMNKMADPIWVHPAFRGEHDAWVGHIEGETRGAFCVNRDGRKLNPRVNTTRYICNAALGYAKERANDSRTRPWFVYLPLLDPTPPTSRRTRTSITAPLTPRPRRGGGPLRQELLAARVPQEALPRLPPAHLRGDAGGGGHPQQTPRLPALGPLLARDACEHPRGLLLG